MTRKPQITLSSLDLDRIEALLAAIPASVFPGKAVARAIFRNFATQAGTAGVLVALGARSGAHVMVGYRRSRGKSRLTCVKPSCPAITRGNYGDIRAGACGRRCHRLLQTSRKRTHTRD